MQAIIYWGRQHRQHFRFANIAQREDKNKNHTQQAPMLGAHRVLFKLSLIIKNDYVSNHLLGTTTQTTLPLRQHCSAGR